MKYITKIQLFAIKAFFILTAINSSGQIYCQNSIITDNNIEQKILQAFKRQETSDSIPLEIISFVKSHKPIIHNKKAMGRLYILQARNYYMKHNWRKINKLGDHALEIGLTNNDTIVIACAYELKAVYSKFYLNDDKQCSEYCKKTINLLANRSDTSSQIFLIDIYFNIAKHSIDLSQWEEVLKNATKSIELINLYQVKKIRKPYLVSFIIKALIEKKQYAKALQYLEKTKPIPTISAKARSSFAHSEAIILESTGDLPKAVEKYQEALKYKQQYINKKIRQLETSFKKEEELNDLLTEVQLQEIKKQIKLKWLAVSVGIFTLFFILLLRKLNISLKKNIQLSERLNTDLVNSLIQIEKNNLELNAKNEQIKELLENNKQMLFSRIMQVSTYNDTIQKLIQQIDKYIDDNPPISTKQLSNIKDSLILIRQNEVWDDFKVQFENIRPNFFQNLKKHSADLSIKDLKHCAYIVANLNAKEVAQLINISYRSVETTRYRIKKKLNLSKDQDLYDFLTNI